LGLCDVTPANVPSIQNLVVCSYMPTNIIVATYTTQHRNILNGTSYPNQYDSPIIKKNPSFKNKKQNTTKLCKKNLHNTKKKLQQQTICVLNFRITKNDLRPPNPGLYPINKNIQNPIHI
jgi:hypothetical protein